MLQKLFTLNAWRKLFSHLKRNPNALKEMKLKPGIKSTEFFTLIGTQLVMTLMTMLDQFDGELAAVLMSGLTAAHIFIRNGFKLKLGMKLRPGVTTSEFWAMLVTAGSELVLAALEKLDGTWATLAAAAVAATYKLARQSLNAMEVNQAAGK